MDRKDSKSGAGVTEPDLGTAATQGGDERLKHIFNEKLREWRHALASLQERLCRDLVSVAVANREAINGDPLDWVREQVENFWKSRRAVFRNWTILGCDSKFEDEKRPEFGWFAPCWLYSQIPLEGLQGLEVFSIEDELPPPRRLSSSYTKQILSFIATRIEMQLSMVAKRVLDKATISLASERDLVRLNPRQAAESLDQAIPAIASEYSEQWTRLMAAWITIDSSSGLYAALHSGFERAPEPAVQARLPKHPKPSSSSDKPKRLRRWKKRELTARADTTRSKSGATGRRLTATIQSPTAARRMEAYWDSKGIGQTEFANYVGTTDRTLRTFRKTGKVRRDIFEAVAKAMGTTKEALLRVG